MKVIWIDISDLTRWLFRHDYLTGIQKVQYHFSCEDVIRADKSIRFCFTPGKSLDFYEINIEEYTRKIQEQDKGYFERLWFSRIVRTYPKGVAAKIKFKLKERKRRRKNKEIFPTIVEFNKGDVLISLGSYWNIEKYEQTIRHQTETKGMKFFPFVHDIIPFISPQLFANNNTKNCQMKLLAMASGAITSTTFTANLLNQPDKVGFSIPFSKQDIIVSPLGVDPIETLNEVESIKAKTLLYKLGNPDFILMVGTLEPRKNHHYALDVWLELYKKHGERLPSLVIVGRNGWKNGSFLDRALSLNYINNKVQVVSDLTTPDLNYLYQNCLFTMFPSYAEGWGIPVQESLMNNKVCIASNHPVIKSTGGNLCEYIDPYDITTAVDVIDKLLLDTDKRIEREAEIKIKKAEVCLSWSQASEIFLKNIKSISDDRKS